MLDGPLPAPKTRNRMARARHLRSAPWRRPPSSHPCPGTPRSSTPTTWSARKAEQGLRISVCLPARDEEATVGHIVATVRRTLMEAVPLVDEVVVIDDRSTDATAEAAAWEGARVLGVDDVLPETTPGAGQGQRDVEVAARGRAATSSAGSTPTSATSRRTS